MKCPTCCSDKSKVLDTRGDHRRRECCACGTRWSTEERVKVGTTYVPPGAEIFLTAWRRINAD
jgi:transcriptional regulator NrdR family protein